MRLLIITQKVDENDDVLGFFIGWIREFAKRFEKVTVICLKAGAYHFPANVKVLSLGKERGLSKISYLYNFYKYIIRERKNYQAVFVHMNPQYIVLGGLLWRLWKKKISLWYAHGYVPLMLRLADKFTHLAFASTKEGYRINSGKLKIVGQGIDGQKFYPVTRLADGVFRIITVGRISPSKDYETLIQAISLLSASQIETEVLVVGGIALKEHKTYLEKLKNLVRKNKLEEVVKFTGPVANKDLPPVLQSADLFVNMSHTGSLDKTNLEAMACGLLLLTCNEAFGDVLGSYRDQLMYSKKDFPMLAEKIKWLIRLAKEEREKITRDLREIVVQHHNLDGLIAKITATLNG